MAGALVLSSCTINVGNPEQTPTGADPFAPPTGTSLEPSPQVPTPVPSTAPTTPPTAAPRTVAEALGCRLAPDEGMPNIVDAPDQMAALEKVRSDRQESVSGEVTMEFFRTEDMGETWLMFVDGQGFASFRLWDNETGGASIILDRYCA